MTGTCDDWWREAGAELTRAQVLKNSGDAKGAYHHAGQAVEFALKAIYMKRHGHREMPENTKNVRWHNLNHIVSQIGMHTEMGGLRNDRKKYQNWLTVRDWSSNARFPQNKKMSARELSDLFIAVCHERDGVMQWLEIIFHKS
jgi:hypothetical protein